MEDKYVDINGEEVSISELKSTKAIQLAETIKSEFSPFIEFIECKKYEEKEYIVFDIEPEVGQYIKNDIRRIERIAVEFEPTDMYTPKVFALRKDFPFVPHLNLELKDVPRSLCLFDQPYSELKRNWTSQWILKQIYIWLSLTAKGELHEKDQPLEPLIWQTKTKVILPCDFLENNKPLNFRYIKNSTGEILIANNEKNLEQIQPKNTFISVTIKSKPHCHGVIDRIPNNLYELHEFMKKVEVDFLGELRVKLKDLHNNDSDRDRFDRKLLLVIIFPKIRSISEPIETYEIRSFIILNSIKEVGLQTGVWDVKHDKPGFIFGFDDSKTGNNIDIHITDVLMGFSRENAAIMNGVDVRENKKIVAVGMGALGSQIFMNLIRCGFGEWKLIDDDCVLPHNLSRHAADGFDIGYDKVLVMSDKANRMIDGGCIANAIHADILNPKEFRKDIEDAIEQSDIIIDFSASVAVSRFLASNDTIKSRCISMFLNPSAKDAIILSEDKNRNIRLDWLEMIYYRYIVNNESMEKHLKEKNINTRYANSCRSVSSRISQDLVAIHSATCSMILKDIVNKENAMILISRTDGEFNVNTYRLSVDECIVFEYNERWKIYTDKYVLDKIFCERKNKLPNETGGILIGSFDMEKKVIYVVDSLKSPKDSKEYPTAYIRGNDGLEIIVKHIEDITIGNLCYIGEWHSHPDGYSCNASNDDLQLLDWIYTSRIIDGIPGVMLIAGNEDYKWYIKDSLGC